MIGSSTGQLAVLRVILALAAAGEALAAASQILRPRQFAEANGRPYVPQMHGSMQDFGFYNLAIAILLVVVAWSPTNQRAALTVVVVLWAVHAAAHLLRFTGVYIGGGVPIPTRPRALELRDGLQLVVPLIGVGLFVP